MNFSIASAALTVAFVAGWYVNGIRHDKESQKILIAHQTAVLDAKSENDKLKQRLEEDHAKTNAALNVLLDTPAPRVRLTICPPAREAVTAGVGIQTEQASRLLSAETERILDADRQRTKGIIGEAEQELNECRVVMEWAKIQR